MGKILVLYKSKYGATKKYADMLKDELSCDILAVNDYRKAVLDEYDWVIFAGAIYASGISGMNILRKIYGKLQDRKFVVFCVGASPFDEKAIEEIKRRNLREDLRNIPLFYGRGAWNESSMSFKDRTLCKMLQKMIAKQDPAAYEPWMKALLSAMGEKRDWTDRAYLAPLIEHVKSN